MSHVQIDFSKRTGKIKPLSGVNSGPKTKVFTYNATDLFLEAGIPFCRMHDSEYPYGSGEFVDIHCIFKNFDADENDPASYNFALTDHYIAACREAGADILYRLGESIEHAPVKQYIHPPKDFAKWARICEHIIRHYNEGWANGFYWNLRYWEIWNEPDLDVHSENKRCWSGTTEQFYDFFETAARHLKGCFPHLRIGGPGIAGNLEWGTAFIREMGRRGVPMDFFSWHRYTYTSEHCRVRWTAFGEALQTCGYPNAEQILTEWNYVENWSNQPPSFRKLVGMRGAAFCGSMLTDLQHSPIALATYFEADVTKEWCGLFEVRDMAIDALKSKALCVLTPRKPFYAFRDFGRLYRLGNEVSCDGDVSGLHACAATDGKQGGVMVVTYRSDLVAEQTDVTLLGLPENGCRISVYLTDEGHTDALEHTMICTESVVSFSLCLDEEQLRYIAVDPL